MCTFLVDKYCDRNFPFEIAKRLNYKDIKTTSLLSPGRQKKKIINIYNDCHQLEYDSGESFSKIKAKLELEEDERRFNKTIEIGNSIRLSMKEKSLKNVANIIEYMEEILQIEPQHNIPLINKIEDERVEELERKLILAIKNKEVYIDITEMDIIGTDEVFYHNDSIYSIKYGRIHKKITELNVDVITEFVETNNLDIYKILDIEIIIQKGDNFLIKRKLKELIDYTEDEEKAVIFNGIWYEYNDDYLKYLSESLGEIEVIYEEKYDFSEKEKDEYIVKRSLETGECPEEVKKSYYREKIFNIRMEENFGFKNYDRKIECNVESMDLYRDKTMFAVKIGNTSGKLCYVVEQSKTAAKMYKDNRFKNAPEVENVAIWLILERKKRLQKKNGKIDINELDMLMLKNSIDSWKKEVRLLGYKPIIYINYYDKI